MVKIYYILRQFDLIWTEWNHKLKAVLWNNFFYEKWKSIFWMEKYIFNLEALHMWTNSVKFSHSVVSDSLRAHEPQHTRPPCPSPTPGVYPHPCPSSRWSHPTISCSVVPFSSCPQSFPASGCLKMSALRIRWPKYWSFSFSISPSNEYSRLISFKIDWLQNGCDPKICKQ